MKVQNQKLHSTCLISRLSLSVIYFWFGAVKVLGESPAMELVINTASGVNPSLILPLLGLCECLLGMGFMIPALVPMALRFLFLHLMATALPGLN